MTDAGVSQYCASENTENFDRSGNNICRNLEAGSEVKGMLARLVGIRQTVLQRWVESMERALKSGKVPACCCRQKEI